MSRATATRNQRLLPSVLRWGHEDDALPVRPVKLPSGTRQRTLGVEAPPWLDTGTPGQPFHFGEQVGLLCADIARRCPELAHIETSRLLIDMTQARSGQRHGLQARVTPLRFRQGTLERQRGKIRYRLQRYYVNGVEILYLVTFCLPRFLDQTFDEKFITLFHELYHISPGFEGDLRRLGGRCDIHSTSKREYDAHMAVLARAYLASGADPRLHAFLRLDFAQLLHRHGSVVGAVVPRPRLVPIEEDPPE